MPHPTQRATNPDLARFFDVCDETRCEILQKLGLRKRRSHPWSEVWAALGLSPDQPEDIWDELMLGPQRSNVLWDATRVGEEVGVTGPTVHAWCRGQACPAAFPSPVLDLESKSRRWLPLEARAFNQPSIYGDRARMIARKPPPAPVPAPATASKRAAAISWNGTLNPLPD